MNRRLLQLNGLSILAVVCNHAAGNGLLSMFWWAHRYRPVTSPNFDMVGTGTVTGLLIIRLITFFSVPAFLFTSGWFVGYAMKDNQVRTNIRIIRVRIVNLLIPYLIWSIVIFFGDYLLGNLYSPLEYIERLVFGKAVLAYYYIPLLIQYYILSIVLVPLVKSNWRTTLLLGLFLSMFTLSLRYLMLAGFEYQWLEPVIRMTPWWFFPRLSFFFVFGLVANYHRKSFGQVVSNNKYILLMGTVFAGILSFFEYEVLWKMSGEVWIGDIATLSSTIYATLVILCFLAFHQVSSPFSYLYNKLGKRVYGIYLLHYSILDIVAKSVYHIAPAIFACQFFFVTILIVTGLATPLLAMRIVSRSPFKRSYRLLFG